MDEQADQVVPAGVHAEHLDIEQMGKPGEGVPVAGVERGEGPADGIEGKAVGKGRVAGDILVVVEVNEAEGEHLAVDEKRGRCEEDQSEAEPGARRERRSRQRSGRPLPTGNHGVFTWST